MPMMRNPFRKQEDSRQLSSKPDAPLAVDIKTATEYKLSEISDDGTYLPPSPSEKNKTFWSSRSNGSTTSSNPRSILSPDEPFNISRESFDSYRRSFDISARSPIIPPSEARPPRISLESRMASPYQPRSSSSFQRPEPTQEEDYEDVGLQDDSKPRKRSFFGRFGDSTYSSTLEHTQNHHKESDGRLGSSHHGFYIGGRRRTQSGTGQELGDMKGSRDSPKPLC